MNESSAWECQYITVDESTYGLFSLPSRQCRSLGDLAALAGRQGSGPSDTAPHPSQASQGDGMGILGRFGFKWGSVQMFADGLLHYAASIGHKVMRCA